MLTNDLFSSFLGENFEVFDEQEQQDPSFGVNVKFKAEKLRRSPRVRLDRKLRSKMEVKILMETSINAGNFDFITPKMQKELQLAANLNTTKLEKLSEKSSCYRNSLVKVRTTDLNEESRILFHTPAESWSKIDDDQKIKMQIQSIFDKMTTIKFLFPPLTGKCFEPTKNFYQLLVSVESGIVKEWISIIYFIYVKYLYFNKFHMHH